MATTGSRIGVREGCAPDGGAAQQSNDLPSNWVVGSQRAAVHVHGQLSTRAPGASGRTCAESGR